MPKETKQLIENAREKRGTNKRDKSELVVLMSELKNEIFGVKAQKSKHFCDNILFSDERKCCLYALKGRSFKEKEEKLKNISHKP